MNPGMTSVRRRLAAARPEPESAERSPLRVLVVDDDHVCSGWLRALLSAHGVEVRGCMSAEAGLRAARHGRHDVLLIALELPSMTGFEALAELRAHRATCELPLLVISARADARTRAAAFAAGADCFLSKPLSEDEVRAAVLSLGARGRSALEREDEGSVLDALGRLLDLRVPGTGRHMRRCGRLARGFGALLGLGDEQLRQLERAARMHDVGKLALPASVLNKPGPLSESEWELVRRHPQLGERLCARLKGLSAILPIVRHHHEHWDGGGYPDRLGGEEIPLLARVLQIVDVYEALVSRRCYKPALPEARALQILEEETTRGRWDPELVPIFVDARRGGALGLP